MKKLLGLFLTAQFLLLSGEVLAQGLPAPSYWKNERGSELFVWSSNNNGSIQGTFTNHAQGFQCQGIPYPASGAVKPTGLYFVVTFAQCNSFTRWVGRTNGSQMPTSWTLFYVDGKGQPKKLKGCRYLHTGMVARGSFYFSFCRAIETWFAARLQVFDADRLSFSFILLLCLDFAFRQAQAARGAIRVSAVRFFLVEPDQLDQVLDSKVGEGLDADFSDTIDPDGGPQVIQSVATSRSLFVFAEVLGKTIDGGDVMNLVDVMVMKLDRRSQRSDAMSK